MTSTNDGALWFINSPVSYSQDIRLPSLLPSQEYWFTPNSTNIRVVADGFQLPNGITFQPNEKVCYFSDTAASGSNVTQPRTIYAFDISVTGGQPVLGNMRVFTVAAKGIPDRIKVDGRGEFYVGVGGGIEIFSPGAAFTGRVAILGERSSQSVHIAHDSENRMLFGLAGEKLWLAELGRG